MSFVRPAFAQAPPSGGTLPDLIRRIATVVNSILSGKLNAVLSITLTPSMTTTTVVDSRIGVYSAFLLQPLTASAVAALYSATSVRPTTQMNGTATFTHPSNAATDQNFNLVIIG